MKRTERVWKKLGEGEEEGRRESEEGGEKYSMAKATQHLLQTRRNHSSHVTRFHLQTRLRLQFFRYTLARYLSRMEYSQGLFLNTNAWGPADICRTAPPRPIE